jgi:hypothetical protein
MTKPVQFERPTNPRLERAAVIQRGGFAFPLLVTAALLLLACSGTSSATETNAAPSKVEPIQGSSVGKVTLLESAAKRLALQTAPLQERPVTPRDAGAPGVRKVVPYAAVIYDLTGAAWVYTSPEALAYVRQPVVIDYVEGEMAVLSAGPSAGTQVVIVGAAELYGSETGVGR